MKKQYIHALCWLMALQLGWALQPGLQAQSVKRTDDQTFNYFNNIIEIVFNPSQVPGLSVGILYGGELVYANAWGRADDNGNNFTINTKSLLASGSKTITGIMAMKMVENGDLGLDTRIGTYLPEYSNSMITIRHLLSHQSGIAHYPNCPGDMGYDGEFEWQESVDEVTSCNVCVTPPGSATLYSTPGITLLGAIIEKRGLEIYNKNYRELYNDWIRTPAGLSSLVPAFGDSDPALARGYSATTGLSTAAGWSDIGWKLPAGGFISDIIEYAKYAKGVMRNTFISAQSLAQMSQVQTLSGNSNMTCGSAANPYGLAFVVGGQGDDLILSHSGLNSHGYTSYIFLYPARGSGIVLLCNSDGGDDLLKNIEALVRHNIFCPGSRDFTTDITWNAPLYYEAEQFSASAQMNHTNGNLVFDARNTITLRPGFVMSATPTKTFHAFIEGCLGNNRPF